MAKTRLLFGFEEPEGWTQFREGNRYVFDGPDREELIVQGLLTLGEGSPEQRKSGQADAVQNAVEAATQTAADPALVLKHGLTKKVEKPPLEIWSIDAITRDGGTRFFRLWA